MTPPTTHALVVGYGSIGRRHAGAAAATGVALAVVDARAEACAAAREAHPGAVVGQDIAAVADRLPWGGTAAVVATWGPSHAALVQELISRGCRRVLCEKPMAASVADARAMLAAADTAGCRLLVHHYLRYTGLADALGRFAGEHGLGEPVAVLVHGGAACLVTNGIHWIDFAIQLFGASPEGVVSTAREARINPRSPDLGFFEGTAAWTFPGGAEASISFFNGSSVAPEAMILYRDAVIRIDPDLRISAARRDPAAVERFPAVTRTGPASQPVAPGPVGILAAPEALAAAWRDLLADHPPVVDGRRGLAAVEACIAALEAGRAGSRVALPLADASDAATRHWTMS